jgi:quercetin dioxygenase-like cupin family protein
MEAPRRYETEDEPEGGDPPCWAHLFADPLAIDAAGEERIAAVDLPALARQAAPPGPVWTRESADLDVNLLVFASAQGVAEHVNDDVDVLLVGVAGEGLVEIDGAPSHLGPGLAVLIPKGARRSTRSLSDRFAYLTCHRRRGGLRPR